MVNFDTQHNEMMKSHSQSWPPGSPCVVSSWWRRPGLWGAAASCWIHHLSELENYSKRSGSWFFCLKTKHNKNKAYTSQSKFLFTSWYDLQADHLGTRSKDFKGFWLLVFPLENNNNNSIRLWYKVILLNVKTSSVFPDTVRNLDVQRECQKLTCQALF